AAGKEIDTMASESSTDLKNAMEAGTIVVDVRKPGEYEAEHVEDALLLPLDFINDHMADFPKDDTFHVHCAGGYRSVIAGSILKSRGIHNLINVEGGYKAIKETGIPVTDYVCPTT